MRMFPAVVWFFICMDDWPAASGVTSQEMIPTISIEPTDSTTIFEYGDGTVTTIELKCQVDNLQPGQNVSWIKGVYDVAISDNSVIRDQADVGILVDHCRYFIVGNETYGEFNLQIRKASYLTAAFDSGRYQCVVFNEYSTLRSRVARVNNYAAPSTIYPQCSVTNSEGMFTTSATEGEALTVSCRSDVGYPTISMMIFSGNSPTILNDSLSIQDGIAIVSYVWIANASQESNIFTCTIDHPVFSIPGVGKPRNNCSVGPFNILRTRTPSTDSGNLYATTDSSYTSIEDTNSTKNREHRETFPTSVLAATFIGGILLGVSLAAVSGKISISLYRQSNRKYAMTDPVQEDPTYIEMQQIHRYQNVPLPSDMVASPNTEEAQYQSLCDRPRSIYTSLRRDQNSAVRGHDTTTTDV